ncbi:TetR/AcrR family transcriptional regulator [Nocardiopsis sediminis]|uniref:TetR/AcrR family transcriptional regulator n=1 Tax=Nocardiopsis sediminis TaxID=1778267 RepID=A0ABV8FSK3_9ACTN
MTGGQNAATGGPGADGERVPVPGRLLAAATRLFAEQGFERTSVQELVDAAGVTKGAMYHYFSSKDDLLYAVYQRLMSLQMRRLTEFAAAPGPIAERVRAAAADLVHTTVDNLDDAVIFYRSMHMLSADRQAAVRKERRQYHELFRSMIEQGRSEGVFRSDVPADIVATQYFGAVHHLGRWYRRDGELDGPALGEHFAGLLMAGLRPV